MTIVTPKDFLFRALRDFRRKNPTTPYMNVSDLARELRLDENLLVETLTQLHDLGVIEFHPMWPILRAVYVPFETF